MSKRKGSVWIGMGIVLIAAALVLTGYNLWMEQAAGAQAKKVIDSLSGFILEETDAWLTERISESGETEYPDYVLNPYMDMPVKEINGAQYIGILEIPKLGLELPIQSTWSYPGLKVSPCRYDGSVYLDNMVICSHNYNTHFGRLKELDAGDLISFTDMDGNKFEYAVAETEILQPTAVEEMISGNWDLTLFTCTIGGATRVTVRCDRSEESF